MSDDRDKIKLNHTLVPDKQTIQSVLVAAATSLSQTESTGSDSPRLDAEILLAHVLHCDRSHLIAWPDKQLQTDQLEQFESLLEQRIHGTPIAYLTGSREFWSLDMEVSEDTLIPRPETETLVEYVLEHFPADLSFKLLDAGTGSGAIAVAIASERPGWKLVASDVDQASVQLAQRNAGKHGIGNIEFLHSDWFDNIEHKDFDIIISNPPYIAEQDPHLCRGDVRFEPRRALTSGTHGMDAIEHLCQHAVQHLKPGGRLIVEHGYDQADSVYECFRHNGFINIEQTCDLGGHIRMTAGRVTALTRHDHGG
jgi:release factor glutamine methyltransferase